MPSTVEKTIEIIFAGTDNVSGVISDISKSVEDMGAGIGDIASPFEDMTEAIGIAQLAIAGLATAGVVAAGNLESEVNRMTNALGLPAEEAIKFKDIAKDAYEAGFVDNLTTAFDGVILAQQRFGDNSDVDLGKVVDNAAKLEKTFGVDMNESMNAVSVLMKNFGVDSTEAFELISDGYQKGLDGSGDFIQSITEYSTQFANGNATASEFFSILDTGYQDGYLGADKAADAFKEFRVRIQDGSKLTAESLATIGIDNEELQKNLQSGQTTAFEAFNNIIKKIGETDSEQAQMIAGVGLMGTQFEDLGLKAVLALDGTKVKIEDIKGTMDGITFDDFETRLTSAWRVAIGAVADMPEWGSIGQKAADVATDVSKSFADAIGNYNFQPLLDNFLALWDEIGKIFTDADLDLTTIEGMENAIKLAADSIDSLIEVTRGQVSVLQPLITGFVDLVKWFNTLDGDTKNLAGQITAIGTSLAIVGSALSVGGVLLSGLSTAVALISGPVGLVVAVGALSVALARWVDDFEPMPESYFTKPRDLLKEFKEDIELFPTEVATKLTASIDSGATTQEVMGIIQEGLEATDQHFNVIFGEEGLDEVTEDIYSIPDEKPVMVKVNGEWAELDELEDKIDGLEETSVVVGVDVDSRDLEDAKETIEVLVGEGDQARVISIEVESTGVDEVKEDIDEIPSEKILEVLIQGDFDTQIALIETQAATVQSALEWNAKVDISEAQANADIMTSAFDSVGESVLASSDVISDTLGYLSSFETGVDSLSDKWFAQDLLEDQVDMQQQALDLQAKLVESQTEYMDAKTEALEAGESVITIDSNGLEPALEMIMWQIIQKVQVKANEEASDFLLGL